MARCIQVLLPLVYVVLGEAQLHIPFLDNIPGLHQSRPASDGSRDDRINHNNVGYNGGYNTWFQHFGNPDTHQFSSENHERGNSYEDFDPFYHGDPYYQGDPWNHMPGINNVFNIPNPVHNSHRHQPPHKDNPQEKPKQDTNEGTTVQKPEEKPKEIPPVDKTPTAQDNGPKLNDNNFPENKLNEAITSDEQNNPEGLPPKTNEIIKEDEKGDKNKKQVGIDKKKDYLLVGQDNNPNNVYLLHENNPNPAAVITTNANQPGNNIIYVPYNPGQPSNQVQYQVVNGQPATLPNNIQMTQEKIGASNGYNNVVSNPGQGTMNVNAGNQNPGYVTIYSNGQLIQIPGVVVNQVPNNVRLQNGNQGLGTNYIIANTVPNNVQTAPTVQNPGTNVIYATLPNQATNGPIYVQVPNCCDSGAVVQNPANNGMSTNAMPSNVVYYQANPNTVAQPAVNGVFNGYAQPNMVTDQGQGTITIAIPNQGTVLNNQNGQYQPAIQLPVNSGSNGYNQPIVSNLGQTQYAPNAGINSQNVPIQTTVQVPVVSGNTGYDQPTTTVTSQRQEVSPAPNQGVMYNQNMPVQPAVNIPVNNGMNSYNQPMVSNQGQGTNAPSQVNNPNMPIQTGVELPLTSGYNINPPVINPNPTVETRGDLPINQNVQPQVTVAVDTGSNGYNQPQAPIQGDQGTNAIVNTPGNGAVINQESDVTQPIGTSSLVLDTNNLSYLGAQPAIMISDFKDKKDGDKKDKADKKKSKDKKEKKDKGKKKDKKPKGEDKLNVTVETTEVPEPFTNKKIDTIIKL